MNKTLVIIFFITISFLIGCGPNVSCNLEKGYCKDAKAEQLEDRVREAEGEITRLNALIGSLQGAVDSLEGQVPEDLKSQLVSLKARVAELESNQQITEIIDPCGPNPGKYDEVLFRLTNGQLVAYLQEGNKGFLTIVKPGNYQTTDKQKCNFSVSSTNEVID